VTLEKPWTPGPWPVDQSGDGKRYIIGKGLVEGPNGYEVAEVYADDAPYAETRANARLIAAAPDLYEALEAILQTVDAQYASGIRWDPAQRDAARKALAKANGETVA
jgi:hypothetical protein